MNSVRCLFKPLSIFCSSAEKTGSHSSPWFYNKDMRKFTSLSVFYESIFYHVSHFDKKCCERHLSLSLNRFFQTHPLTIVINNQINNVLSVLQSIHLNCLSHVVG